MQIFEVEDRVTVNHRGAFKGIKGTSSGIKVGMGTRFSVPGEDGRRCLLEIEAAITHLRTCLPYN